MQNVEDGSGSVRFQEAKNDNFGKEQICRESGNPNYYAALFVIHIA
jgi:hypothetical protein